METDGRPRDKRRLIIHSMRFCLGKAGQASQDDTKVDRKMNIKEIGRCCFFLFILMECGLDEVAHLPAGGCVLYLLPRAKAKAQALGIPCQFAQV